MLRVALEGADIDRGTWEFSSSQKDVAKAFS
jgi:hypothetical protein